MIIDLRAWPGRIELPAFSHDESYIKLNFYISTSPSCEDPRSLRSGVVNIIPIYNIGNIY